MFGTPSTDERGIGARPGSRVQGAPWERKSASVDGGGGWHVPDLIRARGSDAVGACRRGPFRQSRRQRGPKTYPLVRRAGCGRSSRPGPDQRREPILERHVWKTTDWSEPVAALSGRTLRSIIELMCISSIIGIRGAGRHGLNLRAARRSRQAPKIAAACGVFHPSPAACGKDVSLAPW